MGRTAMDEGALAEDGAVVINAAREVVWAYYFDPGPARRTPLNRHTGQPTRPRQPLTQEQRNL